MNITEYAYWIVQVLLSISVLCAVYRVFIGPSVLDRVISVDVILIIVGSMLITDMVVNNHQDFILFVLATSVIAFLGAVAIARYVAVRRPHDLTHGSENAPLVGPQHGEVEPEAPGEEETSAASYANGSDDSTSWFTTLVRTKFAKDAVVPEGHSDSAGSKPVIPAQERTTGSDSQSGKESQ